MEPEFYTENEEFFSHLQDLFEFPKLALQLPVVFLQQGHPVLQPSPVLPEHGSLGQHLRLGGVHVEAAQGDVRLVKSGASQGRHLAADYLEVVVLLLQVGVLQLQLPGWEGRGDINFTNFADTGGENYNFYRVEIKSSKAINR